MRLTSRTAAFALVLASAGCGSVPVPAASSDRHLTATITGHIFTDGKSVTAYGFVDQTANLSWKITYTALVNSTGSSANLKWTVERMDGQVTWHGSPNLSCSGRLSAYQGLTSDLSPYLDVIPGPGGANAHFHVEAAVPDKKIIGSSDTNPADAQCNTEIAVDFLGNGPVQGQAKYASWSQILHPVADFGPNGGSLPLSFTYSGPLPNPPPGSTVTVDDTATETLTLTVSS